MEAEAWPKPEWKQPTATRTRTGSDNQDYCGVAPRCAHGGDRLATTKQQKKQADTPKTDNPAQPLKPLRFHLNLDVDAARAYLQGRGVTDEIIQRYGLGLARKGVLKGYVAIPIYGYPRGDQENPLAYLGRWPGEDFDQAHDRPRYKIPAGFEVGRVVYGLPEAMETLDTEQAPVPLIIVEGPFKVFHLVQCGYLNTVSTLTANVSDHQAEILSRTGLPVVLLFDSIRPVKCWGSLRGGRRVGWRGGAGVSA